MRSFTLPGAIFRGKQDTVFSGKRKAARTQMDLQGTLTPSSADSKRNSSQNVRICDVSMRGVGVLLSSSLPESETFSLSINDQEKESSTALTVRKAWAEERRGGKIAAGFEILDSEKSPASSSWKPALQPRPIYTAAYIPETVVMNEDIAIHPGDPAPIVLHRTLGTNQRHATGPDESNASMLTHVAKKILDESGYSPKDIGRIICVCDPPDNIAPATAVKVQANIGAICPAFDMSMSCSGWLTALDLGLKCIATGEDKILVLASCFFGSRGPFRDVKHRAIFGDACGGLLLEQRHLDMFLATGQWTDGRNFHHIFAPHKWSQTPDEVPEEFRGYGYMNPEQRVFFDALSDILPPFCDNLMERAGVKKEDIDLFLLHYPSKPLFEHSLKVFPVPRKKMLTHFNRFANTIAAEMPVLLDEAIRTDRISPGDLVFMVTYGAGFTMAGAILRY